MRHSIMPLLAVDGLLSVAARPINPKVLGTISNLAVFLAFVNHNHPEDESYLRGNLVKVNGWRL